jgi:uncharacterized protein DUF6883
MELPNRALAVSAQGKLTDYLLNTGHKRGGTKARLLEQFGYIVQNWRQLEADIHSGLGTEVDIARTTEYGARYEIHMTLQTPLGVPLTGTYATLVITFDRTSWFHRVDRRDHPRRTRLHKWLEYKDFHAGFTKSADDPFDGANYLSDRRQHGDPTIDYHLS